jgi:hypothetical protein
MKRFLMSVLGLQPNGRRAKGTLRNTYRPKVRPGVEALEDRLAPSGFDPWTNALLLPAVHKIRPAISRVKIYSGY